MTWLATTLVVALVLGCAYWVLVVVVGLRTLRAVPSLDEWPLPADARWPALSVVSPACDEAETLREAGRARLATDYPDVEFIVVDDRSRDGTGAIADELAAADPRVRALHVRELPEGWLGKVHAMETGLRVARGEWVLFSDADVHFAPDALRRALALAQARGLDHLAVLPRLLPGPLLLDAAISAFGRHFTLGTRPWAVEDPKSKASVGVGAFNLVRRSALERVGGLHRLRLFVADDLALGAVLKASGARQSLAVSRRAVYLQWYDSLGAMARGLAKGLFAYAGRCQPLRLLLMSLAVTFLDLSPWLALLLPLGLTWLTVLGAVMSAASLVSAALGDRWAGRPMRAALLQPVGSLLMGWIIARAAVVGWRRGGVVWRGTLYPSALLREALSRERGQRGGVPRS